MSLILSYHLLPFVHLLPPFFPASIFSADSPLFPSVPLSFSADPPLSPCRLFPSHSPLIPLSPPPLLDLQAKYKRAYEENARLYHQQLEEFHAQNPDAKELLAK